MGVDTNAILFYGYVWDTDEPIFNSGSTTWETRVVQFRGDVNPWDSAPAPLTSEWLNSHRSELDAHRVVKRVIAAELKCNIGYHGADEYACPYVYVVESEIIAYRGVPKCLTDKMLVVKDDWNALLDRFVEEVGIEILPSQDRGWHLVSWWG